jgi:hypothetical protein
MATMVRGPHISFKTVVCSTYTCPSRQVGFQHLRDVYPPCGIPIRFLASRRKQDTRREEFHATFKKTKMGSVNYVSGLICSLDILSIFLRDQLHLFRFFTCLRKTCSPSASFEHWLEPRDIFHGRSTFLEVLHDSLL